MTELKTCDCGGWVVLRLRIYSTAFDECDYYSVWCDKCNKSTGEYKIKAEAIEAWNLRRGEE